MPCSGYTQTKDMERHCPGAPVMDQSSTGLDMVQTLNKKTVPAFKSLQSKYKMRDNRWMQPIDGESIRKQYWSVC